MPTILTVPAGQSIAELSAAHLLKSITASDVILVPTRRAVVTMRQALQKQVGAHAALLPRIFSLADIDRELIALLGPAALDYWETVPPAMPDWQQRYLLAEQIALFECRRLGETRLENTLGLANDLMQLHDNCIRHGIELNRAMLDTIAVGDYAVHWEQSLQFLNIVAQTWPAIEQAYRMITAAARETQLLRLVAQAWYEQPPSFAIWAIGSTASHPATADLLATIAELPKGCIILPGLDTSMSEGEWNQIQAGHPLYYLHRFLARWALIPRDIPSLAQPNRSIWLEACLPPEQMMEWKSRPVPPYDHLHLIPCQHAEEEARIIALLMRESLENPAHRTALVTPDEGLMVRVAAHMKRYGIIIDRLSAGTLASTQTGSGWLAILDTIAQPEKLLNLRSLLHHALSGFDSEFLELIEPYFHGVMRHSPGQLPAMPEVIRQHPHISRLQKLVRELTQLSRERFVASRWVEAISSAMPLISGQGAEAVADMLDVIASANRLGPLGVHEFRSLVEERFSVPWRDPGLRAHPQLSMLTPVEARLHQFDRVILANMQDTLWPGIASPNAWLNYSAQAAIGLPGPAEQVSLMAHDMLMLASAGEVFLTWPRRDHGSPTTRSRFVERLVTLLAMHGIDEKTITNAQYNQWAEQWDAADHFAPAEAAAPIPTAAQRPDELPVSAIDYLFNDPYRVYARYILGLVKLNEIDAEPQASDFGVLAHRAIQALTLHWNEQAYPADIPKLITIADTALSSFAQRPNIALFWRTRLIRALEFVNRQEAERRAVNSITVLTETKIKAPLVPELMLQGQMDRLEQDEGALSVIDYKTGYAPNEKELLDGRATQLLAYAMLLAEQGNNVTALEYWQLPHGKQAGGITWALWQQLLENDLPAKLREALGMILQDTTPFLTGPSHPDSDYTGISRYDEWAG